MDIWMPDRKIITSTHTTPGVKVSCRGEYRAVLTDQRGRVKHDSGWRPNYVIKPGNLMNKGMSYMAIGDSSTAPADGQVDLQGTQLGSDTFVEIYAPYFTRFQTAGPPIHGWHTTACIFGAGNGVGTVREAALGGPGPNEKGVRFVLDTPIVKGAGDQLTIEYKFWMYPDATVESGTTLINGVSWDWEMGYYKISDLLYQDAFGAFPNSFLNAPNTATGAVRGGFVTGGTSPVTPFDDVTGTDASIPWSAGISGGVLSNTLDVNAAVRTIRLYADPDTMNGTFSHMRIQMQYNGGIYLKLLRTSDSAEFTKENTHRFEFEYTTSLVRYVP